MIKHELVERLLTFREQREWEKFHTPRNLSASLVIEASELLECFRWARDEELGRIVVEEQEPIQDEMADIAILLTYLCVDLGVDLDSAVARKLEKNAENYPVGRSRGISKKYDKL